MAKVADKGVATTNAGRFPSRHRLSTVGAEDPLPMVRLPARGAPRNVSRDTRGILFREALVNIEVTAIWLGLTKSVRVPLGVRTWRSSNVARSRGCQPVCRKVL